MLAGNNDSNKKTSTKKQENCRKIHQVHKRKSIYFYLNDISSLYSITVKYAT